MNNEQTTNKKCLTCNIFKPYVDFYKKNKQYIPHCKICYQQSYLERSRNNKQFAINYLGGKCSRCGYNKCNAAIDFHHIDSNTKKHSIAHLIKSHSIDKLISELDKCIILCANCHREEHHSNH